MKKNWGYILAIFIAGVVAFHVGIFYQHSPKHQRTLKKKEIESTLESARNFLQLSRKNVDLADSFYNKNDSVQGEYYANQALLYYHLTDSTYNALENLWFSIKK